MFKKIISGAFAATLVLAAPTIALACNWGAQSSGDCKKLDVTVQIERGNSEEAGYYDLYWSKDGNPKKGEKIATGQIPILKKDETHNITYDVSQNKNGKEGRYIFHLVEPKGSIWSKEIVVTGCTETPPPATDNGGTTPPPTTENGGTTPPPTAENNGGKTPTPIVTKPNGGKIPNTASSYSTAMALGAALVAGGALTIRFQKNNG
ncbi:hypothetical protein [Shimazuella kribbensis]|uniref:hypothetical protein n=1 Tax=Shimazuella kribbensis TaxID=139808 RepID=UPI00040E21A0|nr:hypothetical protein [Shimazuella kribbensis]